tara:strand:+ start:914 stop:1327 length:414 start_codon:yes stop_codon:yes gene_type:complete
MIKYRLICKNCSTSFDSWFASSLEYEKLKKRSLLNCINCNSKNIEKNLMAPKLMKNSKSKKSELKNINKKIKDYQKFIKDNFEYVGNNFAYEARSIHYDNKKKDKGVYGHASAQDLKELKEEGIQTEIIPWIEDKTN